MVGRADRLTTEDSSPARGRSSASGSPPGGSPQGGRPQSTALARVAAPGFTPESDVERRLAGDPVLLHGWAWGTPRRGHPEGSVGAHVADLLRTIDEWGEAGARRSDLRFLALVHDSLKFQVDGRRPKVGTNDHAVRAGEFARSYTSDQRLLSAIEEHDRPYQIWCELRRTGTLDEGAVSTVLRRVTDPSLFMRFVELDGSTPGKNPEPVAWFRDELRRRRSA